MTMSAVPWLLKILNLPSVAERATVVVAPLAYTFWIGLSIDVVDFVPSLGHAVKKVSVVAPTAVMRIDRAVAFVGRAAQLPLLP